MSQTQQLGLPGARSTTCRSEIPAWLRTPLQRDGRPRYRLTANNWTDRLALNTSRPLFADTRLRRAVGYALDRRALARALEGGVFQLPTSHLLPPNLVGPATGHSFPLGADLRIARKLMGGRHADAVLATYAPATGSVYDAASRRGAAQATCCDRHHVACGAAASGLQPSQMGARCSPTRTSRAQGAIRAMRATRSGTFATCRICRPLSGRDSTGSRLFPSARRADGGGRTCGPARTGRHLLRLRGRGDARARLEAARLRDRSAGVPRRRPRRSLRTRLENGRAADEAGQFLRAQARARVITRVIRRGVPTPRARSEAWGRWRIRERSRFSPRTSLARLACLREDEVDHASQPPGRDRDPGSPPGCERIPRDMALRGRRCLVLVR